MVFQYGLSETADSTFAGGGTVFFNTDLISGAKMRRSFYLLDAVIKRREVGQRVYRRPKQVKHSI